MPAKIRVLFVIPSLQVGGSERSLVELIRRLDRARIEPMVCALEPGGPLREELERDGVAVHEQRTRSRKSSIALLPMLLRFRPDLIHARLIKANLWGRVLGRLSGARVLCEERSLDEGRSARMTFLNRATQPLQDLLVVNSPQVAGRVRERDRLPEHRLRIVPGGVDPSLIHPRPAGAATRWDLIAVHRLAPLKDPLRLVEAMALLSERRPETTLAMVGDGPQRAELEQVARERGLERNISFLGLRQDVAQLLPQARLFVSMSPFEGLSNALMEAMCAGLPALTTPGGSSGLVEPGRTGALIPPADAAALARAVLRYLEEPRLIEEHGAAARRRAEESFDPAKTARMYQQIYQELVRERGA